MQRAEPLGVFAVLKFKRQLWARKTVSLHSHALVCSLKLSVVLSVVHCLTLQPEHAECRRLLLQLCCCCHRNGP